jgi:hypothetical protein
MEFLLAHEAAEVLHSLGVPLTPARVRALERAGELRAVRTASGTRLFRPATIRRFAARRAKARRAVSAP